MQTQCTSEQLEFSSVGRRRVVAAFDGGQVSSDCGALLLKKTDEAIRLIDRLADCFIDQRSQSSVEHSVRTLVAQIGRHTSELQSRPHLVCRLLLEKKKKKK